MENSLKIRTLQALNIVAFLVMAGFNALAEILPINDKTTRQLSDQYPNLFTPAGFTFSIWSVIYLLLLAFTIFQASGFFSKKVSPTVAALHKAVGLDFVLTSFLNASWIIVWHFEWVALSVVIMLIMLYLLVNTLLNVTNMSKEIKTSERFLIRASFGLYTGWISMAAIANITVFLVWAGWDGFGLSPEFWTAAMIGTGTIITLFMLFKTENAYYGLVVIWALFGIMAKQYEQVPPERMIVLISALCLIIIAVITIIYGVRSFFRKTRDYSHPLRSQSLFS